jgi:hypothetical protein
MMVSAISSGLPTRLSGTVAAKPAFLSAVPAKRFSIPVSIGPGATMLMRAPDAAASSAADLVSPSAACLLAENRNVTSCPAQAFIPPSTVRFAPVMYEDSGPATNATIAAISSTRP